MIVECSPDGDVRLLEPSDFRRFKVALKGQRDDRSLTFKGITFVDDNNALVAVDLVPTLPGRPADASWDAGYADMVRKAAEHGWIDSQANAIRAHIEKSD